MKKKNGIKMSDCKFYVNEDERTVVCVIESTRNMVRDFIYDNFQFKDINMFASIEGFWGDGRFGEKVLTMPNSFIGKAVCAAEDEWDEELGKKIAFARAKDKCYKSFFKRANTFVQAVDRRLGDMISAFNDLGLKLDTKREALENEIESKIKKEGDA